MGNSRLEAYLEIQANAAVTAASKLFELGWYTDGADLLRAVGLREELVWAAVQNAAKHRDEEIEAFEELYADG